ncbi:MAG TPA: acyl-CoA thioesterase domain-containing protein [Acidimicrobiales bacterium]
MPITLEELLDVEQLGDDVYRAHTPPDTNRPDIFGGQVASQALSAAARTVGNGHVPNSVHCYFLRRGQPELPIDLHVERTRGGRTYTSRRIDARQDGKSIFSMLASFHGAEPGVERELPMPAGAGHPDDWQEGVGRSGGPPWHMPFEMRDAGGEDFDVRYWARVTPFPADPVLHCCALLYVSDMRAGSPAIQVSGVPTFDQLDAEGGAPMPSRDAANMGSLDHALWFHATPQVDEWFFCEVRPLTVRDSRGLVLGTMHDAAGHHLATFAQEMFMKVGPSGGAGPAPPVI